MEFVLLLNFNCSFPLYLFLMNKIQFKLESAILAFIFYYSSFFNINFNLLS